MDSAVEMGTEFWMGIGDATDSVADTGGDGFAGAFGGGVGQHPRSAVGSCSAAQLDQDLFAFVTGTLLTGEVGVSFGGREFVVQLSQAPPVREKGGAVEDKLRSPRVRAMGDLAAGKGESGQISPGVGKQVCKVVQAFAVAEIGRVSPVIGLPHVADASQLRDIVTDLGWSFRVAEVC